MKTIFLTLVLTMNLSGCVGFSISNNGEFQHIKYGNNMQHQRLDPPDRVNPDGSKTYIVNTESAWCGLTIFAIVPIPLMLPICHYREEVTDKDGVQVLHTHQDPVDNMLVCGPGMWLALQPFCRAGPVSRSPSLYNN